MAEATKRKPGRPGKKVVDIEASAAIMVKEPKKSDLDRELHSRGGWPTKRAVKLKIYQDPEQGYTAGPFKLGDAYPIWIRRGVEVIVPYDVISILDDCVVDMPKCDMSVLPPRYYTEKETRFQYAVIAEVPWEEYEKYRAEEAKKPFYIEKRA